MKFNEKTLEILKHFASIGGSINIEPLDEQRLYIMSTDKRIIARARNIENIDLNLPIFDIIQFMRTLTLFKDIDYDITLEGTRAFISSVDGRVRQSYGLSDTEIMRCPTPDKTDKYFEADLLNISLKNETIQQINQASKINGAEKVTFISEDGKINILVADMSDKGSIEETSNQFKVVTDIEVDKDVFVGLPAESLSKILAGNYEVGLAKQFVRFTAPSEGHVDYVCPTLNYSRLG